MSDIVWDSDMSIWKKRMEQELLRPAPVVMPPYVLGMDTQVVQPYDHEHMLCVRMRWANANNTPFAHVHVYAVLGRKVFITIITKDMKSVVLEAEDDALFPSDHLIAEIRTLGG